MIHSSLDGRNLLNADIGERRSEGRLEHQAEAVIAWNHDLAQRVRVRVVNISESGMRIASTLPILEDSTGLVFRLLPDGVDLNKVFTVRWVRDNVDGDGEYHAGLQFLS